MRFAVIAAPRTGSSHLTDLLHNQPDIFCNGEICHPKKVFVRWRKSDCTSEVLAELAALRTNSPAQFLERILDTDYGRSHVGFKILKGQNRTILMNTIADRSIRKIILFRRNVLASYSSQLIAAKSGKYGLKRKKVAKTKSQNQVPFDPVEFSEFTRKYFKFYRNVMSKLYLSDQIFHFINYEEINSLGFFSMLVKYIGADANAIRVKTKHIKQNSMDILSRFSNRTGVEHFLCQHDLQHWAYEGEISLELFEGGR